MDANTKETQPIDGVGEVEGSAANLVANSGEAPDLTLCPGANSSEALCLTLCLGANCGDRRKTLEEAVAWLSTRLIDFRCSDIYETPAYGHDGAPYLNAVATGKLPNSKILTNSNVETPNNSNVGTCLWHVAEPTIANQTTAKLLLSNFEAECKRYELACGRDAEARRLNLVPIDIDIVIAGTKILRPGDYNCSFFQIGYNQIAGL